LELLRALDGILIQEVFEIGFRVEPLIVATLNRVGRGISNFAFENAVIDSRSSWTLGQTKLAKNIFNIVRSGWAVLWSAVAFVVGKV
jgi:hypothetical protein